MELGSATMAPEDRAALREAVRLLESPSFAARLASRVGMPAEKLLKAMPRGVSESLQSLVRSTLEKCLEVAVHRIDQPVAAEPDKALKIAAGLTGGAGGFFGMAGLAVELPVTTTIMLRSIAEIARREGEDFRSPEARLACLEVFALGGRTGADDAVESGYYAVRAVLARAVSEAARYIAQRGLAEEGAPVLVRLIAAIASRFGLVVSEKAAAAAVPLVGALGGAAINVLFLEHFQNIARGHFTVRRLERKYGAPLVRAEYERLRAAL
ncbi:MAG: EcsC family protein [Bryobacterales bacterium]|nr:EcsC family protein [Bryobacteraceae bacterium]MDW8355221.1 EcsC family protein [Bryobacterales bacterium]